MGAPRIFLLLHHIPPSFDQSRCWEKTIAQTVKGKLTSRVSSKSGVWLAVAMLCAEKTEIEPILNSQACMYITVVIINGIWKMEDWQPAAGDHIGGS